MPLLHPSTSPVQIGTPARRRVPTSSFLLATSSLPSRAPQKEAAVHSGLGFQEHGEEEEGAELPEASPAAPVGGSLPPPHHQQQARNESVQGDQLTELLRKIGREVELERLSKGGLPDKIWIKQQFSIGVNDVTRVLERMAPVKTGHQAEMASAICKGHKGPLVPLQAVLLASDCNPRYLTSHIPSLASSRGIPLIFVRDGRGGSLRLGELVKLKTAMAIGVKVRGSRINKAVEEVLDDMCLEAVV